MAPAVLKELWWFRSTIILVATPLLLILIFPFYEQMGLTKPAGNCLYMLLLMAVYWCTEVIPLAVTSLIPLVLAPLLSIQKAEDVAKVYLKDLNVMFMGGLMVAVVIEHSQLHRRIALSILRRVGTNPRFLMLGFMVPTWLLSMWISNTATTAMMIAIVQAVVSQLNSEDLEMREITRHGEGEDNEAFSSEKQIASVEVDKEDEEKEQEDEVESNGPIQSKWTNTNKALSLCVCYAATCGGIATLTGTAPNVVLGENVNRVAEELGYDKFGFDFVTWMGFGFPISFLMLVISWIWLQIHFVGFRCNTQTKEESQLIKKVIDKAYSELGPMKFKEVLAVGHFVLLAVLWITKNPGNAGGWSSLFPKKFVSDGTAAMLVVTLAFMWPAEMPDLCCLRGGCGHPEGYKAKRRQPLITWNVVSQKVPWGLILLLGGGFALAQSIEVSGLSKILGESLNFFEGWPTWGIVMFLATITAFITEITSNTAISTIFLPIVDSVARQLKLSPLYLMLPVTAAASFAFMLPVATPPNALVFATGVLTIKDMAKAGAVLNVFGIGVVTLATMFWGTSIFSLDEFDYSLLNSTISVVKNSTSV